ncbi:MAG: ABC transporter transmembrane domain-containing protein, partial [Cyanobacteria bacterium J06649_11]
MLTENNPINLPGEPYLFKSNEPLLLDNPHTIWLVKSGSFALFAINIQNGIPKGRRRYLFSVKAGEAMFGAKPPSADNHYQILAVSLETTEFLKLSHDFLRRQFDGEGKGFETYTSERNSFNPAHLKDISSSQKPLQPTFRSRSASTAFSLLTSLIEPWIHHLGSTVSEIISQTLPTPAKIPGCTLLEKDEIFQPPHNTVVWTKILQGKANLLGLNHTEITSNTGIIPLQTYLWLQAKDIVEIDSITNIEITNIEALLNGVSTLQTLVLQAIAQLEQQANAAEIARIQQREQLNQQAITSTLDDFANIFDTQSNRISTTKKSLNKEDALLFVAGAVGKALDITIYPPGNSEDLRRVRNPLDAISRTSRIRIRRITLRDGWWCQDSGPLLAYTMEDNRPVAVLPTSETSYEIIDPIKQTRVRCNKKIAATLAPTAYTFYRPLHTTLNITSLLQFALKGHYKELFTVFAAGIATTLISMITPQATAILIDSAIPDANKSLLYQIALGLIATTLGATLFQLTQGFAIMRLETFADTSTQAAVWDRLLNLQPSFFRQYSVGDLSSRVSVISQIRQKLSNTILKSFFSSLFSLLNLGLLFYYSPPLALIAALVAGIKVAVTIISGILTLKKIRPLFNMQGKLFGMMVQIINGV